MTKTLQVVQIFSAIVLIASVLLQQKGSGLSSIFGGEGSSYRTKRGAEKFLFFVTIIVAILFFGSTLLRLIISVK